MMLFHIIKDSLKLIIGNIKTYIFMFFMMFFGILFITIPKIITSICVEQIATELGVHEDHNLVYTSGSKALSLDFLQEYNATYTEIKETHAYRMFPEFIGETTAQDAFCTLISFEEIHLDGLFDNYQLYNDNLDGLIVSEEYLLNKYPNKDISEILNMNLTYELYNKYENKLDKYPIVNCFRIKDRKRLFSYRINVDLTYYKDNVLLKSTLLNEDNYSMNYECYYYRVYIHNLNKELFLDIYDRHIYNKNYILSTNSYFLCDYYLDNMAYIGFIVNSLNILGIVFIIISTICIVFFHILKLFDLRKEIKLRLLIGQKHHTIYIQHLFIDLFILLLSIITITIIYLIICMYFNIFYSLNVFYIMIEIMKNIFIYSGLLLVIFVALDLVIFEYKKEDSRVVL